MEAISKIKNPEIFLGVATVCKVKVYNVVKDENEKEKVEAKNFLDIFEETMENFNNMDRKKKRELLKILEKANTAPEALEDGNNTKNTTESAIN